MAPKVLELGCGAGNLSHILARHGFSVVGIDISPAAIDWAREIALERGLAADFRCGDVVTLDGLADAEFQHVVDGHCLHCIIGNDRALCLRSVRRVIAPEGRFYVVSMVGEVLDPLRRDNFDPTTQTLFAKGVPVRHIGTPDSVAQEIEAAGFSIEHLTVTPRQSEADQDDLLIVARPARFKSPG